MNDQEILELLDKLGFEGQQKDGAFFACKEVRRKVTQRYYSFMQHANNAAQDGTVSPRQLDRFFYGSTKLP